MLWGHRQHPIHTSTSQVAKEDNGRWARLRLLQNEGAFPRSTSAAGPQFRKHSNAPPTRPGSGPMMHHPHPAPPRARPPDSTLQERRGRGALWGGLGVSSQARREHAHATFELDPAGFLCHPGFPHRSCPGRVGPGAVPPSWGSGGGAGPPGTEPSPPSLSPSLHSVLVCLQQTGRWPW